MIFRTTVTFGVAAWLMAGAAMADEALHFGPAPDWVKPMTIATVPSRDASVQPYAILSQSFQVRFADDGNKLFAETAIRIQDPLGLRAGQPALEWDPVTDIVTIHKVQIIRNGQVIDLLARGQAFTVMRRETSLDQSIIDGRLTAVMETDGLQVGDIVNFAATITNRTEMLNERSETLWRGLTGRYTGHSQIRAIWPNSKPMHWRTSDDMPIPTVVRGAEDTELNLTLDGHRWPPLLEDAPARFNAYGTVQFTQFNSWTEVSALVSPYYDRAATLGEASPLRAEAARIKALSDDPKIQAAAALQLVENAVRYASNDANTAGFIPPSADMTWLRRWGDCKAKSVLLVALLRQLGIRADPALVNTRRGDGMNLLMPAMAVFNHVIVRANIDGKTYWLDGTGYGDGALDNLDVPPYAWTLPLVPKGEELQAITVPPFERPQTDITIHIDASGGLTAAAPARLEYVERGDLAIATRVSLQNLLPEDKDKKLRTFWRKKYAWIQAETVSADFDPASGELHYVMNGKARLHWAPADERQGRRHDLWDYWIDSYFSVSEREKGLHDQAPVAVEYPKYERLVETIVLPDGGKGFSVQGPLIDKTLGGVEIKRSLGIKDGVFTLEAAARTTVPEIPLPDAKIAEKAIDEINDVDAYIEAPLNAPTSQTGATPASGSPASTVAGDAPPAPETRVRRSPPTPDAKDPPLSLHDLAELYAGYKLP